MVIEDLDARRRYWDAPRNRAPREEHDLVDSLPYPFEPVEYLFIDKDVLEIGPGRGRQYNRLKDRVRSYSVCDISSAALFEPMLDVNNGFLLSDYSDDFDERFDIVHFWYVLHHVKLGELDAFFAFVARHLHYGGLALFNSPQTGNVLEWYTGNGLGTTWMDKDTVVNACMPHFTAVEAWEQNNRSSGFLFAARKQ